MGQTRWNAVRLFAVIFVCCSSRIGCKKHHMFCEFRPNPDFATLR